MAWLRTESKPRRYNGDKSPRSPKTLRGAHMTLRSFSTWGGVSPSSHFGLLADHIGARSPGPRRHWRPFRRHTWQPHVYQ